MDLRMTEQKKDLTGIFDLTDDSESAQMPAPQDGFVFEETPQEKIDHFESLESLGQTPAPENEAQLGSINPIESTTTQPNPSISDASLDTPLSLDFSMTDTVTEKPQIQSPTATQTDISQAEPTLQTGTTSQKLPTATLAEVPAAFPFSLLIEGHLSTRDQEKLIDIINQEKLGIREIDLEPQLEANRVLLPRISEFAGIYIIQQLKDTQAKIQFGPSETIFAAQGTQEDTPAIGQEITQRVLSSGSQSLPAQAIIITTESSLPGLEKVIPIDTLIATGTLETFVLEASQSQEYQELLDSLQLELKSKAHRKGASALLNFKIQLTPLSLPSRYRITLTALAVKSQ